MSPTAAPLRELSDLLAGEPQLAPHLRADPDASATFGRLAAAGPRTHGARDAYALIVEAVREGYLLHYGDPRLLAGVDADLALLAGDHLYALGLDRLAALGDLEAVRELSDLISLAAQIHDGERPPARAERELKALWLACATAIAAGPTDEHEEAKAALRAQSPDAAEALYAAARRTAVAGDIEHDLGLVAEAIDFRQEPSPELG